ncbi:MAG: TetR/AcrR family transcriptional regulator [Pontimonas sp.]
MGVDIDSRSKLRVIPVQQRSANRMEALLDAAAALIDEGGIDAVTTTAVAYRSGSSVGVLYRYFPNVDALLGQLATRNLHLFLQAVKEGSDLTPDEPWSSWDLTLDAFVRLCRSEPSFLHLRFGELITDRFVSDEDSNNTIVAKECANLVAETHSIPVTPDMVFHLEIAVAMGQALMTEAFRRNRDGDEKIIDEARKTIGDYLRNSVPIT